MTPAERQAHYQARKKVKRLNGPRIPCSCGCGTLIPAINSLGKPARFAHGHNAYISEIGKRFTKGQQAWNKGKPAPWARKPPSPEPRKKPRRHKIRKMTTSGYVLLYQPNHSFADKMGYVLEHRLVMEEILGRILKPDEQAHHKNHERADNRPENLMLLLKSEHSCLHAKITKPFSKMSKQQHREAGIKGAITRWQK
jgi:hypothetical protein